MWVDEFAIVHPKEKLEHKDAPGIERAARWSGFFARTLVLDLRRVRETTTEAFADLIRLRRRMLRHGRDLKLTNLHDRAAKLYEINRLREILPLR